jgi:NAD(P)H dehydrogenase (quinone)
MAKVLILYYSMVGHIETLAKALTECARSVEVTWVTINCVPDPVPENVAKKQSA